MVPSLLARLLHSSAPPVHATAGDGDLSGESEAGEDGADGDGHQHPPTEPAPASPAIEPPVSGEPSPSTARVLGSRALVIIGLCAVAITQPILDLLGANPEFFIAGNYTRSQIALVALFVVAVPCLVGVGLVVVATLVGRRAATATFSLLVAALAGMFVLALLRSAGLDNVVIAAALALGGALGAVSLERSWHPARTLLMYLSVGQLVFAGLFIFTSRTSDLLADRSWQPEARGVVDLPDLEGPVVVVVLDELPIATLLAPDGSINDERYPGFARLAESSTFFRNASSISTRTHLAVPELLSGQVATRNALPTYDSYERNLFTLLGPELPVHRYEIVTDLCPPQVCDVKPPETTGQAIRDSAIVYGHRVLPSRLRSWLPAIDQSWGNFGMLEDTAPQAGSAPEDDNDDEGPTEEEAYARWFDLGQSQQSPATQLQILEGMAGEITDEPALHLIHVALPHGPWVLAPSGQPILWHPSRVDDPDAPDFDWYWRQMYQRHAAQTGAADRAVDTLIDRLDEAGAWDDALVVITSDHGASLLPPPDFGRTPEDNIEGALRMPIFVKGPGQDEGEVSDDVALSIDVVPTIVDLLGAETNWDFDGRSLLGGSEAQAEPKVSTDVDDLLELVERHKVDFPHDDDWFGLAGVGRHGDLVGRPLDDFREGEASAWSWTVAQRSALDDLAPEGARPLIVGGEVRRRDGEGASSSEPPELLVALNGTLAGVAGGFVPEGDNSWSYSAFLTELFEDGHNTVAAYEVDRTGAGVTLRPVADAD